MGGPAIDQFAKLPVIMWPLITIFIGGCESLRISKGWSNPNEPDHVFQKLLPEYVPGDIGFDPLGLKPTDPEEFRIMQTRSCRTRLGFIKRLWTGTPYLCRVAAPRRGHVVVWAPPLQRAAVAA